MAPLGFEPRFSSVQKADTGGGGGKQTQEEFLLIHKSKDHPGINSKAWPARHPPGAAGLPPAPPPPGALSPSDSLDAGRAHGSGKLRSQNTQLPTTHLAVFVLSAKLISTTSSVIKMQELTLCLGHQPSSQVLTSKPEPPQSTPGSGPLLWKAALGPTLHLLPLPVSPVLTSETQGLSVVSRSSVTSAHVSGPQNSSNPC